MRYDNEIRNKLYIILISMHDNNINGRHEVLPYFIIDIE